MRKALEEFDVPVDYRHVRMQFKTDFLALTYLLRNVRDAKVFFAKERLKEELFVRELRWYFRAVFLVLWIKHRMGPSERAAVLKLTSILEYFANVLGEHVDTIRTIRFG